MHAIYSDDHTERLVEKVAELASDKGFYEGSASDGSVLRVLSDKTNSMILEAAAYVYAKAQQSFVLGRYNSVSGLDGFTAANRPNEDRNWPVASETLSLRKQALECSSPIGV